MKISINVCFALAILTVTSACVQLQTLPSRDEPWDWSVERIEASVDSIRAGRDLNPEFWPGGARVAILLSFDVDNETVWVKNANFSIGNLSQGQYGARVGLPRILDVLDEYQVPASFFVPVISFEISPDMVGAIQESGRHEIGIHGWIHERSDQLQSGDEERLIRRSVARMTEIIGKRPVGHRAPGWTFSEDTLDLLLNMNFLYDSSLMADDRPYELNKNGVPSNLVELPVEWILDDAPLINPRGNRYSSPRDLLQVYKDEFDLAYEEETMFLLTLHPHISGYRSRILILRELIEYIKAKPDVWFGTHEEAARWVRQQADMD